MTDQAKQTVVVVYRRTGTETDIDGIDQYSRRLTAALGAVGLDARYEPRGLAPVCSLWRKPDWVLLQYNPFRSGRAGFAPGLLGDIVRLRRTAPRVRLAVMVHEAWIDIEGPKSLAVGLWQRAQLKALLRAADVVTASSESLARELGGTVHHLPVATNITPEPITQQAARDALGLNGKLTVACFGTDHPDRALAYAESAITSLAAAHGPDRISVLNLGAGAPALATPPDVEVHHPGRLADEDLSLRLLASDLVLLPYEDGISTKRTTLMAALSHARPVLALNGRRTDGLLVSPRALALTPIDDLAAYSREAVRLAGDRGELQTLGEQGRRLYDRRFDWPVLAAEVAELLAATPTPAAGSTPTPSRSLADRIDRVVLVAHDVGEFGGMERVSAQLIERLLGAGFRVTVIARTCSLAPADGLEFVRVRAPRKPASLGYPAFFLIASWLVARRRGLVHTTGAIVANRAEVSTVHYCHHASARVGSRASRPGRLYAINHLIHRGLSLAAEAWCYRRGRTGLLCAVSEGVASELRHSFPRMAKRVATVPNGVDTDVFRPDHELRADVRSELGLDEEAPVALFVGGDWERKGLRPVIDALAEATAWRLLVAGLGDTEQFSEHARSAGSSDRVTFLGPVDHPERLFAASDAFVMPTLYEAFPLVALEAAASGTAMLMTRVSGVEDILHDGFNGWFVARDPGDIARRLNQLAADPELARTMGERARATVEPYSWDAMADGYVAVYEQVAK